MSTMISFKKKLELNPAGDTGYGRRSVCGAYFLTQKFYGSYAKGYGETSHECTYTVYFGSAVVQRVIQSYREARLIATWHSQHTTPTRRMTT